MSFIQKVKSLFSKHAGAEKKQFFDDLFDLLVTGDVSATISTQIIESLKEQKGATIDDITAGLKKNLAEYVKTSPIEVVPSKNNVWLVLGVNGVGKTTSVAKIAATCKGAGVNVLMAASDTFRAAAIEQLQQHGKNIGVPVVAKERMSDPSAVIFDAADECFSGNAGKTNLLLVDTAGRLHNKENLVRELQKIDKTASKKASAGCYKRLLVLDASSGQNAVQQAEVFSKAVGVDGIILTKYDSSGKGGVAITLGKQFNLGVSFVCFGEKISDIAVFDAAKYIDEFIGN